VNCVPARVPRLLANVDFAMAALVTFAIFFTLTGTQFTALPVFTVEHLGLSPAVLGAALFVVNAVGFALVYPSAWLADRRSRRAPVLWLLGVAALGLGVLAAARGPVGLLLAAALLGGGTALRGPALQTYAMEAGGSASVGATAGTFQAMGDIGSAVGPVVAGALAGGGYRGFFLLNALLLVAALLAFRRWAGAGPGPVAALPAPN
jgi:MFS family permease